MRVSQLFTKEGNWFSFLIETTPIPMLEASHSTSNTLPKSSDERTSALITFPLMISKLSCASLVYLKPLPLKYSMIGATIMLNPFINCLHLTRIHFTSIFRHDIAQNDKTIRKELTLLELA